MKSYETLDGELRRGYGPLFFELRKRDRTSDSFGVAWSDDGGRTILSSEMTTSNMDLSLRGCRPEHLRVLFLEARSRLAAMRRRIRR